jgi:hypothetical protein
MIQFDLLRSVLHQPANDLLFCGGPGMTVLLSQPLNALRGTLEGEMLVCGGHVERGEGALGRMCAAIAAEHPQDCSLIVRWADGEPAVTVPSVRNVAAR